MVFFARLRELMLLGLFVIGAVFVGAEPWFALAAVLLVMHPVTCWAVVQDVLMLLGALQVLHPETAARAASFVHDFAWPMLTGLLGTVQGVQRSLEQSREQWEAMFGSAAGSEAS
jgi:hypothetical protein